MLSGTQFNNNSAIGGAGATAGQGKGGALFVLAGASTTAADATFSGNTAAGAGQASVGASYGISPYASNVTCPGADTADVCGILTSGTAVTIGSNISGPVITVDGFSFTGAQTFVWPPSSAHTISTTSPQTNSGTQYVWLNWSDNGSITHQISAPASAATITANFKTQYQVTTTVSPAASEGSIAPASEFVDAGAPVQVTATPNTGYVFTGFSGALTGTTNPQSITVNAPLTVTANFQPGPTSLGGAIGIKSGPLNARVWPFTIGNNGPGIALGATIAKLTLQQTSGTACTPVINGLPAMAGDIAPQATATTSVTIDFSACSGTVLFKVTAALSANSGAAAGTIVRYNQLP
jgi:uncharacterized repeat protein (TIGR02543 family)